MKKWLNYCTRSMSSELLLNTILYVIVKRDNILIVTNEDINLGAMIRKENNYKLFTYMYYKE